MPRQTDLLFLTFLMKMRAIKNVEFGFPDSND